MKINNKKKTQTTIIIVVSILLGVFIGWITYNYELVVKAMLGLSFYYFILRESFLSKKSVMLSEIYSRSNQLYTAVEMFTLSVITVWAYFSVTDLLLSLIRLIVFGK